MPRGRQAIEPHRRSKGKDARQEQRKLRASGILVHSESRDGILEELPEAYKNVDEVIEVVHQAGLAEKSSAAASNGRDQRDSVASLVVQVCGGPTDGPGKNYFNDSGLRYVSVGTANDRNTLV